MPRSPGALLRVLGLLTAGAVEVALVHRTTAPGGILGRRYALLAEIGLCWLCFLAALGCIRRLPARTVVVTVLLLGVVLRLASFSTKAPLSDDVYRYAWDGLVQQSGTDPYRYPPDAPQLRPLRTAPGADWLWPTDRQHFPFAVLNREGARTIYPPAAEGWFLLEHLVVPLSARDRGYEAVGLVLDLAVLAVLLALLRGRRRAGLPGDERWIALYALAPLPVLESVQNAHVDTLAVLLVLGAVALATRRPAAAGVAVVLAALVKVYPALLFPLLLRRRGARLRTLGWAAAVSGLAYLPHVLAVGVRVLGYLPDYLREERYDAGTRYLLVGLTGLRGAPATVVVLLAIAALLVAVLRSDLPVADAGVRLLAGLLLLVTPVQPWYGLLLVALATVTGAWWALAVAAAAYPLYVATILDGPAATVGRLSYGLAALVAGAALLAQRRSADRRAPGQPPAEVRAG